MIDALSATVGTGVASVERLGGSMINETFDVRLDDGRRLFVKHRDDAPPGMYRAEASGLAWLAEAGALRLPALVAADERFLALDWIESGRPGTEHDERLGRGLAGLHMFGAPAFGLDESNFIATLPQPNAPCATWPEFYAARRLEPLLRRCAPQLPPSTPARFERLFARLDDLCGPPEPPSRLHGDLWGGNAMVAADGGPVVIDPAVYGGHREIDLGMMRLFGGFSPRVFAAYEEVFALAPGGGDRVALCQLYPLLVHVALFGGSYVAWVERSLRHYV